MLSCVRFHSYYNKNKYLQLLLKAELLQHYRCQSIKLNAGAAAATYNYKKVHLVPVFILAKEVMMYQRQVSALLSVF